MTISPASPEQLFAENESLRTQLHQAEDTLRAIRCGEADALVLSGLEGDYIHALNGGLEPYRVMVESMNEGAVTLATDGTILYCNGLFADWIKVPSGQIVGTSLKEMLAGQDQERFDAMLVQATQEQSRGALTLLAVDGKPIPTLFSMRPLPQSEGKLISVVLADLSEVIAAAEVRAHLALIVESSDDAIISTTLDGIVESWNRAAEHLYGYTAAEAIGRNMLKLTVGPEHADEVKQELNAIRHGEHASYADTVRRCKDGSLIEVSIKACPISDGSDRIVGASISAHDISERKKAELQLLRFRHLIDESNDAVFVVDPNSARFLDVNKQACNSLGYSRDELLAMDVTTIEATISDDFPWDAHLDTVKKVDAMVVEGAHRRKDGSAFPVEISVKYVALNEGSYMIAIARDISERKRDAQKFKDLLESAPDAMVIVNHKAEIVLVNAQAVRLFGWHSEELLGQTIDLLVPERYRHQHPESMNHYFVQPRPRQMGSGMDMFGLHKDGSEFPIEVSLSPLITNEGIVVISAIRDISERKRSEASIKSLNRVLSVLSGINTLIVRVNNREELFRESCNIAIDAGGFRMAMIVIVDRNTMLPISVISAGKDEELLAAIKDVMASSEGRQTTLVAQAISKRKAIMVNNTQSDPRLIFAKQYAEAGVGSMLVLPLIISDEALGTLVLYANEIEFFQRDELKLLAELADDIAFAIDHINTQERLNYLAYYDVLTGLANRTLFLERLAQHIRSAASGGHKLAIGLIDLERFKSISDSLGRSTGDTLLKQVAEWLVSKTGDASLLARIDADHFAFVLPEVKSDGHLANLIENLITAFLEYSFNLNNATFRIGIKLGMALFPNDGDNADILFRNAEAALKKAKLSGDRFLFHAQKMTESVADRLAMENRLRQAIDNDEFVLHYQPKLNLESEKVTSAEALIRWNDPRSGDLVPPGIFIPILEEAGLIYEVGRWALHKAVEDNMRWRKAGLPAVRIAVNVSPLQLRNINFINEIRQVIALDAHAASGLELEITESVIMNNIEFNIAPLQSIRAMGITIAIDDFGTGFSSLSYLAKLPVDTLKIDRSFVIEMTKGPEGLALVSTIINLAHSLKLEVVAEGVETEEQSRLLRLLSCDKIQGFLFSKAVPAEIFSANFLAPLTPKKKE